jgi:hypothetical protein
MGTVTPDTTGTVTPAGSSDALLTVINGGLDNDNIAADAKIAYSKLNLASSIVSNDIADGTIINGDINASAAIAFSKLAALPSTNILVGNGSNVATAVAMSSDATLANTGALTIANSAVTTVKINDGAVTSRKLNLTTDQNTSAGTLTGHTSSTFTEVTNTPISLTTAVSSNVKLTVSGRWYINAAAGAKTMQLRLYRDANALGTALVYDSTGANNATSFSFSFLDKSLAAGTYAYALRIMSTDNATAVGVDTVYLIGQVTAA